MDTISSLIPTLLGVAVLLPLLSFSLICLLGPRMGRHGEGAGYVALAAIMASFVLSVLSLVGWLVGNPIGGSASHGDVAAVAAHHGDGHGTEPHHADANPGHTDHEQNTQDHAGHDDEHHNDEHAEADHGHSGDGHHATPAPYLSGVWYVLGEFGDLQLNIGYYVDALTVAMFAMVTLIASCIHLFAMGYMHDELHDYVDHEVVMSDGSHLRRPGRYYRFFQYLSLFCFSMLGLVVAGNVAMTFVFWELVGICSYFLIGFYVERKSASTAANKAFIVNRVGDFGMIIGLMAIWSTLGTFNYGDVVTGDDEVQAGLFSLVRPASHEHRLTVPDPMVRAGAIDSVREVVGSLSATASAETIESAISDHVETWRSDQSGPLGGYGYGLMIVAGVGIFCGCVGKSAQFPLHVWLPDAMEGPTPVSALVHSATMVAAGVFLVGRFFPMFVPEVLLVIAITGTITLFMAATIAIVATDIKRVLAYSTVSQLGYMMLALGMGGWLAGMLHLFTHAFFKSLLFMCSGSVIHAVHTNEMPLMGGLRKKMPWTAYTMLIGCMAIAGAGLPFALWTVQGHEIKLGFSGFYSKDAILEQAWSFHLVNGGLGTFFFGAAAVGASITAFYMFRMWYLTFAGTPRDPDRYDHAHESPPIMYIPLVIISVFAIAVAWGPLEGIVGSVVAAAIFGVLFLRAKSATGHVTADNSANRGTSDHSGQSGMGDHGDAGHHDHGHGERYSMVPFAICLAILVASAFWRVVPGLRDITLANLLEQARPTGTLASQVAAWSEMIWPNEHDSHAAAIKAVAGLTAFCTAAAGFLMATLFYAWRKLDAEEARQQFAPIHRFLLNKWWFDELYDWLFVRPAHLVASFISWFDQTLIDGFIDGLAATVRRMSQAWEAIADRSVVDGFVNLFAAKTYELGLSARKLQTGRLRHYVMFIAVGAVAVFVLIGLLRSYAFAQL